MQSRISWRVAVIDLATAASHTVEPASHSCTATGDLGREHAGRDGCASRINRAYPGHNLRDHVLQFILRHRYRDALTVHSNSILGDAALTSTARLGQLAEQLLSHPQRPLIGRGTNHYIDTERPRFT